jgi:AcrR family transcriptional regulator
VKRWGPTSRRTDPKLLPVTRRDEQREATRRRIAEVAAFLLTTGGGSPPPTLAVQRAAGVSRGALLHHFPSREDLLTAAVATLRAGNAAAVEQALAEAQGADPIERAVRALATAATRPEMSAEYGLWAAARADNDLRGALRGEERFARGALYAVVEAAFGPDLVAHPAFPRIAALTVQFLRGLAITQALRDTQSRTDALVHDWAAVVRAMLEDPTFSSPTPSPAPS